MKLHRLEFKFINSYYDKQVIDFDNDLADAPLFLVNGPTGAGKSTILDVISLVLFNETPRLQSLSGQDDTKVANILSCGNLSSQTAYIDLIFSLCNDDGVRNRYRARWVQEMTRNNTTRPLIRALYLREGEAWQELVVSKKLGESATVFNNVLENLTAEDFRRLVVLPQGNFDAFLSSDEGSRAALFARLTNTDIYAKIGSLAYSKRAETKKIYAEAAAGVEGAQGMLASNSEILDKKRQMLRLAVRKKQLKLTSSKLLKKIKVLQNIRDINGDLDNEIKHLNELEVQWRDSQPNRDRLARFQLLRPLIELLEKIDQKTDDQRIISENINNKTNEIADLQTSINEACSKKEVAEIELHSWNEFRDTALRDSHEINSLTMLCHEKETAYKSAHAAADVAKKKVDSSEKKIETVNAQLLEKHMEKKAAWQFISDNITPDNLSQNLNVFRLLLNQVDERWKRCKEVAQKVGISSPTHQILSSRVEGNEAAVLSIAEGIARVIEDAHQVVSSDDLFANIKLEGRREELWFQEVDNVIDAILNQIRDIKTTGCDLVEKLHKGQEMLDDLASKNSQLAEKEKELEEMKQLQISISSQEKEVERELWELRRVIEFNDKRRELKPGQICPLCGGTVDQAHLAALQSEDEADTLTTTISEKETQQKELEEQLTKSRKLCATKSEEKSKLSGVIDTVKALANNEMKSTQKSFDDFRQLLKNDLPSIKKWAPDLDFNQLSQPIDFSDFSSQLNLINKTLAYQTEREKNFAILSNKWRILKTEYEDLITKHESLKKLETLTEPLKNYKNACKIFTSQTSSFWSDNILSSESINPSNLTMSEQVNAFETANEIANQVAKLESVLVQLKNDEKIAQNELNTALTFENNAKKEADSSRTSLQNLRQKYGLMAQDSLLELVKGTDLRLQQSYETSKDAYENLKNALSLCKKEKDLYINNLETLKSELRQLNSEWDTQFADVKSTYASPPELDDPRDFVRKSKLDNETVDLLSARKTELETKKKTCSEKIETLRAKIADLEPKQKELGLNNSSIDQLTEQFDDLVAREKKLQDAYVELRTSIANHLKKVQSVRRLRKNLFPLQEEMKLWEKIADLVGKNNGNDFQKFAQAYYFGDLIRFANRHLEQMESHYQIIQRTSDEDPIATPKIDFEINNLNDNTTRPVTTLSGGERFIVSLALSLGLSDFSMRNRGNLRYRIETLLLDEGFGSLDQDSLRLTLNALRLVHDSSQRQIGIISHVEALKEMVESQIVVEKSPLGRSNITVYGSKRIV